MEEIILSHAEDDGLLAASIRAKYGLNQTELNSAEIRWSIREELAPFRDKWGMIEYTEAFGAVRAFHRSINLIETNSDHGAYRRVFLLCTVVLDEAAEATTYTDDSAGESSGVAH